MILWNREECVSGLCKPRASGDDPRVAFLGQVDLVVNPARAGMIRLLRNSPRRLHRKPRASGDDPVLRVPASVLVR